MRQTPSNQVVSRVDTFEDAPEPDVSWDEPGWGEVGCDDVPEAPPVDPPEPPADPLDGRAFTKAAIEEIRRRVQNGEPARVIFDIDDTLADSRGRTLELAKRYDQEHGTSLFKDLTLDGCAKDGYTTARRAGLSKEDAKAFDKYWKQEFYNPANNVFDLPLQEIIDLAKAAKEAGAEVRYLTGRTEDIRGATLSELQRLGLPDAETSHLTMKPDLSVKTGEYKAKTMAEWAKDGVHTGFFITESRRDIAAIQRAVPSSEVPCVLIDAEKEQGGEDVDPSTPIYPSQTGPKPEPSLWGEVAWVRPAA